VRLTYCHDAPQSCCRHLNHVLTVGWDQRKRRDTDQKVKSSQQRNWCHGGNVIQQKASRYDRECACYNTHKTQTPGYRPVL
jgi:hypothetical protein